MRPRNDELRGVRADEVIQEEIAKSCAAADVSYWPITSVSPFGACRLPAKAEVGSLLDHLVRGRQQRFRDG